MTLDQMLEEIDKLKKEVEQMKQKELGIKFKYTNVYYRADKDVWVARWNYAHGQRHIGQCRVYEEAIKLAQYNNDIAEFLLG